METDAATPPSSAVPLRMLRSIAAALVAGVLLSLAAATLLVALALPEARGVDGSSFPWMIGREGEDAEKLPLPSLNGYALILSDFIEEPDTFTDHAAFEGFLQRQGEIAERLRAGGVVTFPDGERHDYVTAGREPLELPVGFWIAFLTGLGSLAISGRVWLRRPTDRGPIFLMLSAVGLAVAVFTGGVYMTRPLAIEPGLFRILVAGNHAGSIVFGFALIGLFLVFPRRLVGDGWLVALGVLCVGLTVAEGLRFYGTPQAIYVHHVAAFTTMVGLIGIQAWSTRHDPRDRATLIWLGLSLLFGLGTWVAITVAYGIRGRLDAMPEAYALGFFLVFYVGLGLGVARYRLFDVGNRAFWLFYFGIGAILFLALDGLLVGAFSVSGDQASLISLLGIALLYLPLRERLWKHFSGFVTPKQSDLFAEVIELGFAPTADLLVTQWRDLLERQFRPSSVHTVAGVVNSARIEGDGLDLVVPAFDGENGLVLSRSQRGLGLFSPRDVALVDRAAALVSSAVQGRRAYERGVLEERRRVARDLHDDVGARLLDALVSADVRTRPYLEEALRDVRSIAHGLNQDDMDLEIFLSTLRHETVNRLEAAGIALDWPLPDVAPDDKTISARSQRVFSALVREALSNTIKHSGARCVSIHLTVGERSLSGRIRDDGTGRPARQSPREGTGMGLTGLAARFAEVGGCLSVDDDDGFVLSFELPLEGRVRG